MVNPNTQAVSSRRSKKPAKDTHTSKKEVPSLRKSSSSDSNSGTSRDVSCASTARRLSDSEVRSIFECLVNDAPIPENLPFTIVSVGSKGLKLSPPAYQFPVGLYVLLKPQKPATKKNAAFANNYNGSVVPDKVKHLMVNEDQFAPADKWSLSGPQFPKPSPIQQRYCYPRASPEYESRMGGALWTMADSDGNELLDYRLLHVYYSVKRASNKGVSIPSHVPASPKVVNNKRSHHTIETSPAVTFSSVSHASLTSPDYFEAAPSYSEYRYNYPPAHYPPQYYHPHHSRHPSQMPPGHVAHPRDSSSGIFRHHHNLGPLGEARQHLSPSNKNPNKRSKFSLDDIVTNDPDPDQTLPQPSDTKSYDSFDFKSLSFTHSYGDFDIPEGATSLGTEELETFWKEPLEALEKYESQEANLPGLGVALFKDSGAGPTEGHLENHQKKIRELIEHAPTKEKKKSWVTKIIKWAMTLGDEDDTLNAPFESQDSKPSAVSTSPETKTERKSITKDAIKIEPV